VGGGGLGLSIRRAVGGGGGGGGATAHKAGSNYQHDLLSLHSINSDKHLSQSPFTGKIFLDDDILLCCLYR
jgi:hypothetical protein